MDPVSRLDALERTVRRWRLATILVAMMALASAALSVVLLTRTVVRAKSFVLTNSAGVELARLAESSGEPLLVIHAKHAKADVMLGSFGEDAGLAIASDKKVLAKLSEDAVNVNGRTSQGQFLLKMRDEPLLIMTDAENRPRSLMFPGKLELKRPDGSVEFVAPAGGPNRPHR